MAADFLQIWFSRFIKKSLEFLIRFAGKIEKIKNDHNFAKPDQNVIKFTPIIAKMCLNGWWKNELITCWTLKVINVLREIRERPK